MACFCPLWRRPPLLLALSIMLLTPALSGCAQIVLDDKSTVDQVLDALDARGQGMKDLSADVKWAQIDGLSGDTTTLKGRFALQDMGGGDSRVRVNFTSKQVGTREAAGFHQEYVLAKGVLIDRDYSSTPKLQVTRQVLQPGQKLNLLKLGEGPFPLPIGQPKGEVQKLFVVTRIAAAKDDPEAAVHIKLASIPNTQFAKKFKTIDVWVDVKTNFPRRIDAWDARETTEHITDLTQIRINTGLGDRDFTLDPIDNTWMQKTETMD